MNCQHDFPSFPLSSSDTLPSLSLTLLTSWSTIWMEGEDKLPYIQGQVTCDVGHLDEKESTFGAHCDAKGKVWSVFRLFHHRQGYSMFQPKSAVDAELAELKKYAIFSKVNIVESDDVLLGLIGNDAQMVIDGLSDHKGDVRPIQGGNAVKIDQQRWLLVLEPESADQLCQTIEATKVSEALWTRLDIEAGFPFVTKAHQIEHIPQALNLQALGGISFSKGCYTGQETVARAKYRGMNKRSLHIIQGKVKAPLSGEIEIERAVGDNWRSASQLMSYHHFSDGQCIGSIVLPNNLDAQTQFRLKNEPESIWTMVPLPYSLAEDS
ncbi:tRNA-modifying protein YgfZ [Vibrio ostreicida]|uniref:tRNA-modifying protein YgfZ n=1 Tax=Vibrio ostreicida TaxID=526588 RepID=UPI0009705EB3|nr:tRNA-modifying protein YgfZ [Vibrio ostreicida]